MYKTFKESFMAYMVENLEKDKDEVFPSELSKCIYNLAQSIGCDDLVVDMKESTISKATKALIILALIAISERTPFKATKFLDKTKEVLVDYVIEPINDKILDPIIDSTEAFKNATKNMIKDVKNLPSRTVDIYTTYSKDADGKIDELKGLTAKVGIDTVKFDVNKISDDLKAALRANADKKESGD